MEIKELETDLFDSVETLIQKISLEPVDSDTSVIILKIHNPTFQTAEKSYNLNILGKKMVDWLKEAFASCPIKEIETDMKADILSTIKPHLSEKKWTAVFYADTPLLERKTFLNILDYVQVKNLNALKLERGYVFNTEFLKNANHILFDVAEQKFSTDNFLSVFNMEQLEMATQILKNRILAHHQQNGVQIVDKISTYIDGDAEIGKNVIIYPNTTILGNCEIGDFVSLGPNCTIKNSKIQKNNNLSHCYIENSDIKENTAIKPFSSIINGVKK